VAGHEDAGKEETPGKAGDHHRAPDREPPDPEVGVGDAGHEPGKVRVCRAGGVAAGKTRERYGPAAGNGENPENDERKAADNPDRSRSTAGPPWQARQRSPEG